MPQDGVSLLPLLRGGQTVERTQPMVWHFPYYHPEGPAFDRARTSIGIDDFQTSQTRPQSAIRVGNYALVHFYEDDRDELYHLSADPGEQKDLSREKPRKAAKLRAALDDYLRAVNARFPTR